MENDSTLTGKMVFASQQTHCVAVYAWSVPPAAVHVAALAAASAAAHGQPVSYVSRKTVETATTPLGSFCASSCTLNGSQTGSV